ncbi:MAG TPA: hypothetical protein VL527_16280 [Dongiaceae bacterium]|jgi:hypothetical protein|nr:hypothetical protein [Dongiaceae bacterium]
MNPFQQRAAAFGAEFVDLKAVSFTPELLRCIPSKLARQYRVLPVAASGRELTIVLADPSDLATVEALSHALGQDLELRVAAAAQMDEFLERLYPKYNTST